MITFIENSKRPFKTASDLTDGSSSHETISILQIEDNPGDLISVFEMLSGLSNYSFIIEEATNLRSAIRQLRSAEFDAILLNLSLPDSEGLDSLETLRSLVPETPIIVVTGKGHEKIAMEAVRNGAQDYLVKSQIEPHAIIRSIHYSIERKQAELRLSYSTKYDDLTGLANRSLFYSHLENVLLKSKRDKQLTALLFLDLDHFKLINDTYGHTAGDLLLKDVANRLRSCVRGGDTVARMGGDEFTITLEEIDEKSSVSELAREIIESISQPFNIEGIKISTSISIGITLSHYENILPSKEMVRYADIAMYHAKKYGRNNFKYFNSQMERLINQQDYLEKSLSLALKKGEFYLRYQAQIDIRTNTLVGAEALIRWRKIKNNLINAKEFMLIVEEMGLMAKVGKWALEKACSQWYQWQQTGEVSSTDVVSMAVPVRLLNSQNFEIIIADTLHSTGLNPACLNLSFPESWLKDEKKFGLQKLNRLKGLGIRISMIGAELSSFNDLKHIPIDGLKVDQSLMGGLIRNEEDNATSASIINLAKHMNLEVIAEGVDELNKIDLLQEHGCHRFQGDFFGKPLSSQTFPNFAIENQYPQARIT